MEKEIGLTELKQMELSLLSEFAEFCEGHRLRYFLAYGTLIGAAKYRGFIPWDDDIDVIMPRPDYEEFLRLASGKISEEAAVLDYRNTAGYIYPFAKVVDRRTRIIEEDIGDLHPIGVYIDVFPVDGMDRRERSVSVKRFLYRVMLGWAVYPIKKGKTPGSIVIKMILYPVFRGIGYRFFTKRLDTLSRRVDFDEADKVSQIAWDKKLISMPREDFQESVKLEFEGKMFWAPANYDRHLKRRYGNYRDDPSPEECISGHRFKAYWK